MYKRNIFSDSLIEEPWLQILDRCELLLCLYIHRCKFGRFNSEALFKKTEMRRTNERNRQDADKKEVLFLFVFLRIRHRLLRQKTIHVDFRKGLCALQTNDRLTASQKSRDREKKKRNHRFDKNMEL